MQWKFDLRLCFVMIVVASLFAFLLHSEGALGIVFLLSLVWLILFGEWRAMLAVALLYGSLFLLGGAISSAGSLSSLFVVTLILRRMMLPAFYAIPLTKAPAGLLMSALGGMGLPRSAVLSLAVLFRFIYSLREEYKAIGISLKFRGIGVGIAGIIAHPVTYCEAVIVPLLIRIIRLSDELSAAAVLRGAEGRVKRGNFYEIRMGLKEYLLMTVFGVAAVLIFIFDYFVKEGRILQ